MRSGERRSLRIKPRSQGLEETLKDPLGEACHCGLVEDSGDEGLVYRVSC